MSQPEVTPIVAKKDVFEGLDPAIKVRTRKMMMWFIILAIVMLFGGITSALIVLYGKLIWLHMTPPVYFWISNAFIVRSLYVHVTKELLRKPGDPMSPFTLDLI